MPTYNFVCDDCGRRCKFAGTIRARNKRRACPSCGSVLRRVPSAGLGLGERAIRPESDAEPALHQQGAAFSIRDSTNIRMLNNRVFNAPTGVQVDGNSQVDVDGLHMTEVQTGFDLEPGSRVDMRNVSQKFTPLNPPE